MPAQSNQPENVVRMPRGPNGGVYRLNTSEWPTERWVAVITLAALSLLILIRMGFRGINVPGVASARIAS